MSDLPAAMQAAVAAVDSQMSALVPAIDGPIGMLHEACRYALLGGGKRLRPFLVIETARLFDVAPARAVRAAAAVELVHTYSLVHDDLPAMDDDDLRRGRPTTHVQFDEATAILAGDALLTLAFEVLADGRTDPDAEIRCALIAALAKAAGMAGMVGGQVIDLAGENQQLDLPQITELQWLKTGALFSFCCQAGAILGRAPAAAKAALADYARALGLAFQIADDLLDIEGTEAELGKGVQKDAAAGKATFASLLGVEKARAKAVALIDQAGASLDPFGAGADRLRAVAGFVLARNH